MPHYCAALNCNNLSTTCKDLSFFRFPQSTDRYVHVAYFVAMSVTALNQTDIATKYATCTYRSVDCGNRKKTDVYILYCKLQFTAAQ